MTDVAPVANQVTAKHVAGAKGAGASAGTGTGLDGAFAALLGVAGQMPVDGEAVVDGKAVMDGKPVQPVIVSAPIVGDPAPVEMAGEAASVEGDVAQPPLGHIDPATGKTRKDLRGKDAAKGDEALLQAQAQMVAGVLAAPVQPVSGGRSGSSAKTSPDGDLAVEATSAKLAASATLAATTDVATAAQALIAKDGKGDKPAREMAKAAPVVETGTVAKDQGSVAVATNIDAGRRGNQTGDGRSDPRDKGADGRADRGVDKAPVMSLVANDDSTPVAGTDPLRDIVQSLPPVVQAQLGPMGSSSVASVASTGDMLSSQVIDMSVSGQWIDRMAREIATVADGSGSARFQLNPPHLGRIQVELLQADDKTNVRVLAETDEAARRLREGQSALEAHARVASLSLGSVSVEKSSAPLDSGDRQHQRQGADQSGNPNQQNFAQAHGQSAQGRGNSSGNLNRGGFSAVIGNERQAEPEQSARATRASDPRVRFA